MRVSIIVAVDEWLTIGWSNQLPWRLPSDLRRFKKITMGKAIIMGRRTFESLGKPLPGRTNIIVTRDRNFLASGCTVAHSVESALNMAKKLATEKTEIMVIGGGEIYKEFFPFVSRIYLTQIKGSRFFGDTTFPPIDMNEWEIIKKDERRLKQLNADPYSFLVLERISHQRKSRAGKKTTKKSASNIDRR
ncbi:MAG TPA: dihydrofolate reductase [Gammaproteobacteria bacterium]|nr:dihydrofolate reductase [Gammaproteobacteria bacterium]